ncbi:bromodomain-containing protein [Cryptosporidium bovis]|uniref:bromodomain-containing protein n=1 Tax=Cryptosporidium bovis TaxID=310047 RepID=UPI00351AADEC|nr:bromodomain-containing protein [Cryptosporidium bovis]
MKNNSRAITSSIRRKLSILLETLRKDHNFEIFINPIDPIKDGCLDYYQVIKSPMDLSTVSKKLMDNKYNDIVEFYNDIMLIFSNCREYNTSPLCSHIINLCDDSEKKFILEWNKLDFVDKVKKVDTSGGNDLSKGSGSKQITTGCVGIKIKTKSDQKVVTSQINIRTLDSVNIRLERPASNKRIKNNDSEKVDTNTTSIPTKKRKEDGNNNGRGSNSNISCEKDSKGDDWKNECLRILNLIRKEDNSFLFENPVLESDDLTTETKTKYEEIISEPCDYSTVEKRLFLRSNNNKKRRVNSTGIDTPQEFERLIKLIFSNCMLFNPNTGDCKWIYDAAKQTLNKFNSIWNRSNVFKLYSNTIIDEKKEKEEHKNIERVYCANNKAEMELKSISNIESDNTTFKFRKNDHSKTSDSNLSLNKITLLWNNYSILWRKFLQNRKQDGLDVDTTKKAGVVTRNSSKINKPQLFRKGNATVENTSRSLAHGGNKNINWRNRKRIILYIPKADDKPFFGAFENGKSNVHCFSPESDGENVDDYGFKPVRCINKNKQCENTISSLENLIEGETVEYVIPVKIYHIDQVTKVLSLFGEHDHSETSSGEKLFYNLHRYITKNTEYNADIQINSFETHNDEENVVKNINFVAFSNSPNLGSKCIELKIKTIKKVNKIIFPITSQYLFNDLIIVDVKFAINDAIGNFDYNDKSGCSDNADLRINIDFGRITS